MIFSAFCIFLFLSITLEHHTYVVSRSERRKERERERRETWDSPMFFLVGDWVGLIDTLIGGGEGFPKYSRMFSLTA